ncbi:macoilin-like [Lineus longissimus]|uniref:macoilin-like n=1 Tax=Lineus longissimus TaxID=88925 RepID=UPI002B4EE21E
MKRRNADCAKLRRPIKRSKITDGIYGSAFLYLKFLLVWALVLMADFVLEFRFEYLWPFWLLLRSVYDSFKYQGLAFSVFFVCIAITSDVICYLFIPVQWLFFAASTYVWVQYVWHTDRGICLPTVSLWLLFVWVEASVRLRELKSLPLHLDLCRPFAAHCIGYPMVTLGFGFKSYVSYKMRVRKQKDVQKDNEFYVQLLQQALPPEQQNAANAEKAKALTSKTSSQEEVISNGSIAGKKSSPTSNGVSTQKTEPEKDWKKHNNNSQIEDYEYIEQTLPKHNVNDFIENDENDHVKAYKDKTVNKSTKFVSSKDRDSSSSKKSKSNNVKDTPSATTTTANNISNSCNKEDYICRIESELKRIKMELQSSRNLEQELRSQVNNFITGDKSLKSELYQLQQDNESLQTKLHNLVTSRQQDKQILASLEKKLLEERKCKAATEHQLLTERKAKKAEEAAAARAVAMATAARVECSDMCKSRRRDLENDLKLLRRDLMVREEQLCQKEREAQSLRQYKDAQNETDVLMSALAAMQDKNAHLETSLSAETRLKLDLFSALGEAKRQIEIQSELHNQKDRQIAELKSKIAEVMALMPTTTSSYNNTMTESSPLYTSKYSPTPDDVIAKSNLNPNASDYTPKGN